MTGPRRRNRVVTFDADPRRETGTLNYRGSYENRRINMTMLYEKRGDH